MSDATTWAQLAIRHLGHSCIIARQLVFVWARRLDQERWLNEVGNDENDSLASSISPRFVFDVERRFKKESHQYDVLRLAFQKHFQLDEIGEDLPSLTAILFALQTYYATVVRWLAWWELQTLDSTSNRPELIEELSRIDLTRSIIKSVQHDEAFRKWNWSGLEISGYSWWVHGTCDDSRFESDEIHHEEYDLVSQLTLECRDVVLKAYEESSSTIEVGEQRFSLQALKPALGIDRYRNLYHDLLPRKVRHYLGEYYTPYWLVQRVIDHLQNWPNPVTRLADPACGSGGFLLEALMRWCYEDEWTEFEQYRNLDGSVELGPDMESLPTIPAMPLSTMPVVGIDLSPLAVLTARANLALTCRQVGLMNSVPENSQGEPQQLPVHWGDAITGQAFSKDGTELDQPVFTLTGKVDCIVGNPPWISWDLLDPRYREQTENDWRRLGLFQATGMDCILGKGKKDLSMLLSYAVSKELLRDHGILSFVMTRSVLQNDGSGKGFRRFILGDDEPLQVVQVDDFSAISAFENASTKAIVIVWKKGKPTSYPVPVTRWVKHQSHQRLPWSDRWRATRQLLDESKETGAPSQADDATSPWITGLAADLDDMQAILGASSCRAHEGVNTGGANGVYWFSAATPIEDLELNDDELVNVTNLARSGKRRVPQVQASLEGKYLFPFVRGSKLGRWYANVDSLLLLVQDPAKRRGVDEEVLRSTAPATWEYLKSMEPILRERAALNRYFANHKNPSRSAPFYSMFNVGKYTLKPYKVAWHRMKSPIGAAVLESVCGKLVMPQETHAFVATSTREEAYFLAAQLNHPFVNQVANSLSIPGSKSFASPHLLDKVQLVRFSNDDAIHGQIVELAMEIQRQVTAMKGEVGEEAKQMIITLESLVLPLFTNTDDSPNLLSGNDEKVNA